MRSTDRRVEEVLARARAREVVLRRRRQRAVAIGGGVMGVVAVVAVGIGLARAGTSGLAAPNAVVGLMGSVFAERPALGYVAVGLLGLALGVAITVLAYRVGNARGELAFCVESDISVHTLPRYPDASTKAQVAEIPSENMYTNSSSWPDPDCSVEAKTASDGEGGEL